MSELTRKILGTYLADEGVNRPPTHAWLQKEMRSGTLAPILAHFVKQQVELLDSSTTIVEDVTPTEVIGTIPCALFDNESPHAFRSEVNFSLNLLTGKITRR